jgi:hypothetical protein
MEYKYLREWSTEQRLRTVRGVMELAVLATLRRPATLPDQSCLSRGNNFETEALPSKSTKIHFSRTCLLFPWSIFWSTL